MGAVVLVVAAVGCGVGELAAGAVLAAAVGAAGCVLAALGEASDELARGATFPASGAGPEAGGKADDAAPAMVIGVLPLDSDSLAVADRATDKMATATTPPSTHADFFPIRGRAPGPGSVTFEGPPAGSFVVAPEFVAWPDGTVL